MAGDAVKNVRMSVAEVERTEIGWIRKWLILFTVTLATTQGTLSAVIDKGNGTYTVTLTSATTAGTATITGTVNAVAIAGTATVTLTPGAASATASLIAAAPTSITADGITTSTITV